MSKEGNYQNTYKVLDQLTDHYFHEFTDSFQRREEGLINLLTSRANFLKASIQDLKKKTSQESIDNLISKKKQEKQNERLKLEKYWRGLTEKLKKMQAEDKKLSNENRQAAFDVQNLCKRIEELEIQNENLEKRNKELKNSNQQLFFLTNHNQNKYISPYKYIKKNINSEEYQHKQNNLKPSLLSQLQSVRTAHQIPSEFLYDFLNQPKVKQQIYNLIK